MRTQHLVQLQNLWITTSKAVVWKPLSYYYNTDGLADVTVIELVIVCCGIIVIYWSNDLMVKLQ